MKYRKRPVEIEAIRYTGSNTVEISQFMGLPLDSTRIVPFAKRLIIKTLEGDMTAIPGDYIIKGVEGEFYQCKPFIFTQTYEAV